MRALIQRVNSASVTVDTQIVGEIKEGLLILFCAMDGDVSTQASKLASKISKLRIFTDEAGKMNRSLIDIGGQALVVSQFTLAADTRRGNRPGFSSAARPELGYALYEQFKTDLEATNIDVKSGVFGANMKVELTNDGPVTIWLDDAADD